MKIDTGDHQPIRLRPYRTPVHKRGVVGEAVKDMLDAGIIERSKSPWSFPIIIVEKKDGGHRFCVDFRKLNAITKPMAVPLPLIDDILALLGKSARFLTLDLRSGYWQIALDRMDREKGSFYLSYGSIQLSGDAIRTVQRSGRVYSTDVHGVRGICYGLSQRRVGVLKNT